MARALYVAPTGPSAGLTSTCLGLARALDQAGLRVGFFKPISQPHEYDTGPERSTFFLRNTMLIKTPEPLSEAHAKALLSRGNRQDLMEEIVGLYQQAIQDKDVVLVEGLISNKDSPFAPRLNAEIAKTLDAEIILVTAPGMARWEELSNRIEITARLYGGPADKKMLGCILNKVNAPNDDVVLQEAGNIAHMNELTEDILLSSCPIFKGNDFRLLGFIPWQQDAVAPRIKDVAEYLNAEYINEGNALTSRVHHVSICARTVPNICDTLTAGALIVTPGDREDVIIAVCMAVLNGVPIAGLILTSGYQPNPKILQLCDQALSKGLPMMSIPDNTFTFSQKFSDFNLEVPIDDVERIESIMDATAGFIDGDWLKEHFDIGVEPRLSPPAFRYLLVNKARKSVKRIVLPEGDEPRTIQAAAICHQKEIAECVLIGEPDKILLAAKNAGVNLPQDIEILDPKIHIKKYIGPLVELRKHKGLTEPMAEAQLEDPVVLGTMMLAEDDVDGLVSGAVNTTANTIRPALQLIKTRSDAKVVSSVFFMCLPEQVLIYGDCAVNPDPSPEELADIAIQSAHSAQQFGIVPRVAMISYSTGTSGSGKNVDKVVEATKIAKSIDPEILIDGPLQYDAAAIESVAKKKAPNSLVAGKATVFVFPDLNTGNTTYKAVQRSANVVSIGPMLQGLRKPVNDLSRGALVDDIVYTIALTAVQANQNDDS